MRHSSASRRGSSPRACQARSIAQGYREFHLEHMQTSPRPAQAKGIPQSRSAAGQNRPRKRTGTDRGPRIPSNPVASGRRPYSSTKVMPGFSVSDTGLPHVSQSFMASRWIETEAQKFCHYNASRNAQTGGTSWFSPQRAAPRMPPDKLHTPDETHASVKIQILSIALCDSHALGASKKLGVFPEVDSRTNNRPGSLASRNRS